MFKEPKTLFNHLKQYLPLLLATNIRKVCNAHIFLQKLTVLSPSVIEPTSTALSIEIGEIADSIHPVKYEIDLGFTLNEQKIYIHGTRTIVKDNSKEQPDESYSQPLQSY